MSLGPDLRQPGAGRRDQPGAGQGAERAARGDAGAPGHDRPRDVHPLPDPFLVMATQNPIESDGTYPLPEAQVDRFMLKVLVDYPTPTEEFVIVERMTTGQDSCRTRDDADQLAGAAAGGATRCSSIPPSSSTRCGSSNATRDIRRRSGSPDLARYVTFGASPRASINMILAAPGAGARARPRVRAARGRRDDRARRAAPPPRAVLRGAADDVDARTRSSTRVLARPCRSRSSCSGTRTPRQRRIAPPTDAVLAR